MLVEIKARFDEEANIIWARKLERAGAHVVYGLVGLKTHSKTSLVVRREGSGLRRYVHIGTGNYNPKTARLYVDLGLLTCRPEIGADVTDLFNVLTGLSRQRTFRRILVAPHSLRSRFLELVDREIAHAEAGREARIVLKLNAIVDVAVIEALYRASIAGVDIDLIVRGACSIQPGLPGVSDRIRVRSIVGEFLEHSRIWSFENGGSREWFIGSADLMDRNLDRRVEAVVPVEDHDAGPPAGRHHRPDDGRRPALVAAPAGCDMDPHRSHRWPARDDRHVRGPQGGRPHSAARSSGVPHRPGEGVGSLDPARMTDIFEPVAAPAPVEVELKYRVADVAAVEHYLTAPRVGAFDAHDPAKESRIEDRYVDTDDGAMSLAGYAVRLRQSKSGTIVSVKSLRHTDGPGGAVRREELEGPADPTGGPTDWPTSAARSVVMEHAGTSPLIEVVTIRQVRRRRQIRDAGTRIELSLDEVTVIAGGREVGQFAELEAELRRGAEGRLAELATMSRCRSGPGTRDDQQARDGAGPPWRRGTVRRMTTRRLDAGLAADDLVRRTPKRKTSRPSPAIPRRSPGT